MTDYTSLVQQAASAWPGLGAHRLEGRDCVDDRSSIIIETAGTSALPADLGDVTVLLATFNGARFLHDQLRSLCDQVDVRWRLLWRDDGSTDCSVDLMRSFADEDGGARVQHAAGREARLGVGASYYALAQQVRGGTVAFCDQDDVWLPHKLARGVAALAAVTPGVPVLYCARQWLVDGALQPLGTSRRVRRCTAFPMGLAQNVATGCTIMLNDAAVALLQAAPPPLGTLHDWWSYLLVSGAGGRLIFDDEPVVLYRQHGGNAVGAPHTAWARALAAVRRGPRVFMAVFRIHLGALAEHQALLSPAARRAIAEITEALAGGVLSRLAVLWRYRLRRQSWLETALFSVWFLIG